MKPKNEAAATLGRARCFACKHAIPGKPRRVITADRAQMVYVGPCCYQRVRRAVEGYQPALGGPRLVMPTPEELVNHALEYLR